jgi:hypothetical protein
MKFRLIFAFGENFFGKHKIFPKFYVYFINFCANFLFSLNFRENENCRENFREAKFRLIFAFRENLKEHFRFNPSGK